MRLFQFIIAVLFCNMADALCVKSSKANLRSGPGPEHAITWTVPKYMPLIEVKKVGNWYQVEDMDGESHFVYAPNVTRKIVCVGVRVAMAKLRKSPDASGELADIRQVDKYTPFKRLDVQGDWFEVEASWGERYWIHESTTWRPVRVNKVNL